MTMNGLNNYCHLFILSDYFTMNESTDSIVAGEKHNRHDVDLK